MLDNSNPQIPKRVVPIPLPRVGSGTMLPTISAYKYQPDPAMIAAAIGGTVGKELMLRNVEFQRKKN